eukprot:7126362-Prymnesium_polylepis.1
MADWKVARQKPSAPSMTVGWSPMNTSMYRSSDTTRGIAARTSAYAMSGSRSSVPTARSSRRANSCSSRCFCSSSSCAAVAAASTRLTRPLVSAAAAAAAACPGCGRASPDESGEASGEKACSRGRGSADELSEQ